MPTAKREGAARTYATRALHYRRHCPPLVCPRGIPMLPRFRPRIIACTSSLAGQEHVASTGPAGGHRPSALVCPPISLHPSAWYSVPVVPGRARCCVKAVLKRRRCRRGEMDGSIDRSGVQVRARLERVYSARTRAGSTELGVGGVDGASQVSSGRWLYEPRGAPAQQNGDDIGHWPPV